MSLKPLLTVLLLAALSISAFAQEEPDYAGVKAALLLSEMEEAAQAVSTADERGLKEIEKNVASIEMRWDLAYQDIQTAAMTSGDLVETMSSFDRLRADLADSIALCKNKIAAVGTFEESRRVLAESAPLYDSLYKTAFELSLVKKLAPVLEKFKVQEQLKFQPVQAAYDNAAAAAGINPALEAGMPEVEEQYIALKDKSEEIQKMTFKPFVERAKDYLLSIGAVAILLMYLNVLKSKWTAAKQLKEQAKKYGPGGKDRFYPTI